MLMLAAGAAGEAFIRFGERLSPGQASGLAPIELLSQAEQEEAVHLIALDGSSSCSDARHKIDASLHLSPTLVLWGQRPLHSYRLPSFS